MLYASIQFDGSRSETTERALYDMAPSYVNLSAARVQAQRYQEALDSVAEADSHFRKLRALGVTAPQLHLAHAAGFYNAAVAYWHHRMGNEVHSMLTHAKEILASPGIEHSTSYVVVFGAIARLWDHPDGPVPLGRVLYGSAPAAQLEAFVSEVRAASPLLIRSAARGDAEAARALATLAKVTGLMEDAVAWYSMAANLGDTSAHLEAEESRVEWLRMRD